MFISYSTLFLCENSFLAITSPITGETKYIPTFNAIILRPYPKTDDSESTLTKFRIDRDEISGVINNFTVSLNTGFSRSKSAMYGENE
jgi:hypothetical protein